AGGVGIEIYYDVFAEASQEPGLQFGEGGAGAGDYVLKSGGVNGDAIHLAFDKDGVVELANGFLSVVEVEEHAGLGVDGGFGRVQVFRTGLFVGGEGASGEGDDLTAFVGDGEHYAVAEFGVHGGWRWSF